MNPVVLTPDSIPLSDAKRRAPGRVRTNFYWMLSGNLFYAMSQLGMLVVLARLGDAAMVGQFVLGLAITAPVLMLTNLGLRQIQATDASRQYHLDEYVGLRLLSILAAALLVLMIALGVNYNGQTRDVILLITAAKGVEAISDILYGLFQQHERMDLVGRSLILRGVTSLPALVLGLLLTHSLTVALALLALTWAIVLVSHDLVAGRALVKRSRPSQPEGIGKGVFVGFSNSNYILRLTRMAKFALPLGLAAMVASLNFNLPRYLVERWLGEQLLGVFAAMVALITGGTLVVNALGQAVAARLAVHREAADCASFTKLLTQAILVAVAMGVSGIVLAVVAGKPLLTVLYGSEFAREPSVLVVLAIAGTFAYVSSLVNYSLVALRRTRLQLSADMLESVFLAVGLTVLIPQMGIRGAAWAVAVAASVALVIKLAVVRETIGSWGSDLSAQRGRDLLRVAR